MQVYVDTNDSTRTISCNQARVIIRQLIAGLRAAGVKPGDCIAIHSFNDVSREIRPVTVFPNADRTDFLFHARSGHYRRRWDFYRHKSGIHGRGAQSPHQDIPMQLSNI